MSDDEKKLSHKRLPKWEAIDEIRIQIVPRYKTSGMSGDEWRHHAQVDLMFKGAVVAECGWRDMETAVATLGHSLMAATGNGILDEIINLDRLKCDQPSCQNDAAARFEIKHEYSDRGEDLVQSDHWRNYRKFCRVHLRRGDCSREDSDDNYAPLDGIGPDGSTNTQESPSMFGGVV